LIQSERRLTKRIGPALKKVKKSVEKGTKQKKKKKKY